MHFEFNIVQSIVSNLKIVIFLEIKLFLKTLNIKKHHMTYLVLRFFLFPQIQVKNIADAKGYLELTLFT